MKSRIAALVAGAALGLAVLAWGVAPARVSGDSMEPTLSSGNVVLLLRPGLDRLLGGSGGARPGDIVAAVPPGHGETVVKRVVAGPGSRIAITDGEVEVDGEHVGWGSEELAGSATYPASSVPDGSVYLLGDNRLPLASNDSRSFGPVPLASLRGRVVLVLPLR